MEGKKMKINWCLVVFSIIILIFVVGVILMTIDEEKINDQKESFCENNDGRFDRPNCLIKENGYYQEYKVNWEWSDEKGVREFFLVRE